MAKNKAEKLKKGARKRVAKSLAKHVVDLLSGLGHETEEVAKDIKKASKKLAGKLKNPKEIKGTKQLKESNTQTAAKEAPNLPSKTKVPIKKAAPVKKQATNISAKTQSIPSPQLPLPKEDLTPVSTAAAPPVQRKPAAKRTTNSASKKPTQVQRANKQGPTSQSKTPPDTPKSS